MRTRHSSRLLVLDSSGRVLLFRFVFSAGALAGRDYWGTPGGALEEGETFAAAARRELAEETGIQVDDVGTEVGRRQFVMQVPSGEQVRADERFYLVRAPRAEISRDGWSALEREVMAEHRWWSAQELARTAATVFPEDLPAMLRRAGVW